MSVHREPARTRHRRRHRFLYPDTKADISQGRKVDILVGGVSGKIGQTLAPGVIGRPNQAIGEALPEFNLHAVVTALAGIIDEVHAAVLVRAYSVGVQQEKVDRIGTWHVSVSVSYMVVMK
jgi:hypothetical protein